ncbi:TAXI family TRAP transporter solute-binding subunit [Azospirillum sp. SYSU D00513]|uniref:TAXI family TRAP transporter solute-binding subunit n=1 Tax=Azospirillum sp. SYSU D00513 TaxID=2812561 RepID=UPI001A978C40|nr:TAXI family TRAP transporter solute-binding subunit [Azospirillum sp. SYSU D00513]
MSDDYTSHLTDIAARFQGNELVRRCVGVLLIAALLGVSGYFVYDLMPRRYQLTITGGEILGNRHYLAKVLEEEAGEFGVALKIVPTRGSLEALEKLESGELDLALSQGGLEPTFENIVHAATIAPELIHFIVKPEIQGIQDLRGKVINLGGKSGGTRVVAQQILKMSELEEGVDYVETNFSAERIVTMRPEKLPDVVVNVSFQPSYLAEFLVQERGYRILEIPFPGPLALRLGWVADATILAYTYGVEPPVPEQDSRTIGVNLHLLANAGVPPRAVHALLDALYSPAVQSRLRMSFDEENIALPSGFPLSEGTTSFMARKEPFFSAEMMEDAQAGAGLLASLVSVLLIGVRWFRGKPIKEEFDDAEIKARIAAVAALEGELLELGRAGPVPRAELEALDRRLAALKTEALERIGALKLADPSLVPTLLAAEGSARARLAALAVPTAAAAEPLPEPMPA